MTSRLQLEKHPVNTFGVGHLSCTRVGLQAPG
ncbi:hypothetical protein CABS01_09336 [Colletotrichum abscissum]|uniref:Uncharacterized protein n=2 Tax=Colletotrichum acutatum species complex TaxID=2707335 RepID=A0AAI9UD65_9PEZI|nr:uncharacterized protein CABS01_09336 [Colletotrichum abscissum]KAK1455102.1 hypothetical protein CMEL01_03862 [Colletotrichum melonis]KAK1458811.1 hypothetical protein CCUS01_09065 [Colletotrichum cuscutae]KAK1502725.1 hypothetical protein CABS01_09336 [Colletotrichum abscissum]